MPLFCQCRPLKLFLVSVFVSCGLISCSHLVIAQSAQPPIVDRVEPPSWWTGSTMNPVRLLIHGKNLDGAHLSAGDGLTVGTPRVTSHGTYIFVDITIGKSALLGRHNIVIKTPEGSANAPFEVAAPLPTAGRFQGFSPDDVVYLIMPDRFAEGQPEIHRSVAEGGLVGRDNPHLYHGGDFQGIIDHLPYLRDLGVTAIWINPIYQNTEAVYPGASPGADYHGYGAIDQYRVEDQFGSMTKLREMVDRAHALGIKVIQDEVANHVGQLHPWIQDEPTSTWFNGSAAKHGINTFQVWTVMDPHATALERSDTLKGWFVNILPDLNQDDPEVARYEIQNTLWWIGMTGFDGIREDTMPYVPRSFWTRWNEEITRQYPNVDAVGEVFDPDAALVSYFQGGHTEAGIDTKMRSLFDYPLYFPLRKVFAQGESFDELAQDQAHDWLFHNPNILLTFLGNHDVKRFMNETGATPQGLMLAYDFLLTTRGVAVIYYGDEIGMPGGDDPDNRRDFPGGFPGDSRNAFTAAGRTPEEQSIWLHVQQLTHIRAQNPALRRGDQKTLYLTDKQWVYVRTLGNSVAIVALNNDSSMATLSVPVDGTGLANGTTLVDLLHTIGTPLNVKDGVVQFTLPAKSGAILVR